MRDVTLLAIFLVAWGLVVPIALALDGLLGRRKALKRIAELIGGETDRRGSSVRGTHLGVAVKVSVGRSWTQVEAQLPPYPLSLHVRRHAGADALEIVRGEMVDVLVGEPEFDHEFLVEGAPAEIVRWVLAHDLRVFLLGERRVELSAERGKVRIAVETFEVDPHATSSALACAARLAASLREVTAAVDEAVPVMDAGSAYREMPRMPDEAALLESRAARVAEVQRLVALRAARARRRKVVLGAFGLVLLGAWVALTVSGR